MEIPKQIKEALANNSLVIFAGSGLSTKFKLPSWNKLVKDVIVNIGIEKYMGFIPMLDLDVMSAIEVLDKIKVEHTEIRRYIRNHFGLNEHNDFPLHEKLLEISGQIITTNYDDAFERASKNTIIPSIYNSKFNVSEINKSPGKYIFKLHGSYTVADDCLIFSSDYESLYGRESAAKEKLKSIFAEKTILFLGFSFNDPDINLIFSSQDSIFGNHNKHYILTKEPEKFNYNFLTSVKISSHDDIECFIDECLEYKGTLFETIQTINKQNIQHTPNTPRIAFLTPAPIDLKLNCETDKILNCFREIDISILVGSLNIRTLLSLNDYDAIIINTKVFKANLYLEENNLKSSLLSFAELCSNIPNEDIPIILITDEKVEILKDRKVIYISSYSAGIINNFIFKAFISNDLNLEKNDIYVNLSFLFDRIILSGKANITSIYGDNKDLKLGKKTITSVVGRVEEQSAIALRILGIKKSNKLLNIKASGGTGKTTLIKKIAYELYNRGYFSEGVSFKSCESVKNFDDFEEIVIDGFNLNNILNFNDYLIQNYRFNKKDVLIILDNFETVVNVLQKEEFEKAIEFLKFATDYADIVITSREKISLADDFEDVYSLTPLITDDALELFQLMYNKEMGDDEVKILRSEILEQILNNNPLAIKLVTKSLPKFKHITELKDQLTHHFFESTNEDYTLVFNSDADLNIERTKSIYQSINYSYSTLNSQDKLAFELLNLFPDGISLQNFELCFKKNRSTNNITYKELKKLIDKSLIEEQNGKLQLQPIIRRFAEYQFSNREEETKRNYCSDAYRFNSFILNRIRLIEAKNTMTEALNFYNVYKNNLLNTLTYIKYIKHPDRNVVENKQMILKYIYLLEDFVVNKKQIHYFFSLLNSLHSFFSDVPNAKLLMDSLYYNNLYYFEEFDNSYKMLSQLLSVKDMTQRVFEKEEETEYNYKHLISNCHAMEGYTLQNLLANIHNNTYVNRIPDAYFYYLGIVTTFSWKKSGFYYFEYELMYNTINVADLEKHINSLYFDEHLEKMQCTYTLSKIKKVEKKIIQKLVITNPYTKGLKDLMLAFLADTDDEKRNYFESALKNLIHIKYYYIECLYYYCIFLREINANDFNQKLNEGLSLSRKFYYQYLHFRFENFQNENIRYKFSYDYYKVEGLESYINKHNKYWEKELNKQKLN